MGIYRRSEKLFTRGNRTNVPLALLIRVTCVTHVLRGVDVKFVSSDLPRPNLAEEDSYGGDRVKKSATGTSTTATRSR